MPRPQLYYPSNGREKKLEPIEGFDPVDLHHLSEALKNLIALGVGDWKGKASIVRHEMRKRDAFDDLEEFITWFTGDGWED